MEVHPVERVGRWSGGLALNLVGSKFLILLFLKSGFNMKFWCDSKW
jgi:hypothetical protein